MKTKINRLQQNSLKKKKKICITQVQVFKTQTTLVYLFEDVAYYSVVALSVQISYKCLQLGHLAVYGVCVKVKFSSRFDLGVYFTTQWFKNYFD